MHGLLLMLLKLRPCRKTDNARATNEILKGRNGIINALKVKGRRAIKKKCLGVRYSNMFFFRNRLELHFW